MTRGEVVIVRLVRPLENVRLDLSIPLREFVKAAGKVRIGDEFIKVNVSGTISGRFSGAGKGEEHA